MRPMTVADCQTAVFEVALELARQDKRLSEIASAIAFPPDADAMLDLAQPSTTEVELFSRIECVKTDLLQEAVRALLEAAQLTDAALRVESARRSR